MRKILVLLNYWLGILLLSIYKKIEECRIYKSKIIYDNKYLFKKNKLLIYSVHVEKKLNHYVIKNIKYFLDNGYDIILVVTLGRNSLTDFFKLNCFDGIRLIVRKNFGKDFGAFKDVVGLIASELGGFVKVTLQNDSFIGPLYTSDFLNKIELMPFDVVGITESFDQKYHIQSSFILLNSINSIKIFKKFMNNYKVYSFRLFIIKYGQR
jgi:lipopolysaccharide biosynthesis protein